MTRRFLILTAALLASGAAYAATTNTTLTINATATAGATGLALSGTANLTNIGNGTFSATLGTASFAGPYTITLSSGGTITGTLTSSATVLAGSGTSSATVTGGTGAYSGATGSFPTLASTGTIGATGSISLTFTGNGSITTGGSTGPPPPTITDVLDAASNTEGLAQGSIFIVKGSNLCPSGFTSFNVPRPTTSPDGVKITFTPVSGGTGTDALLWYEYNLSGTVQLAGILPSTVATGNYNVTVTNGSASAAFVTTVTKSKFELFTQDSSGSGLASVQNYISASRVDLNSFTTGNGKSTTISPAHPGQYLLAYGTGMGALAGGDNSASPAYNFAANGVNVQAIVGGMSIPVTYAGRAGYAGEDQINFALPSNVPTGCAVSFQISVNGALSAPAFIAIAPDANASVCVQQGFTAAELQKLDAGGTYTVGGFELMQIQAVLPSVGTVTENSASGSFTTFTGYQLAGAAQASVFASGNCVVTHSKNTSSTTPVLTGGVGLDAGAVTLNGPAASNISNMTFKEDPSTFSYSLTLATSGLPSGVPGGGGTGTIVAGQYSLSGAGGKDVGKFSSTITLGTPLLLTGGLPTSVNRANGLPLAWTGGNSSDIVEIIGSSSTSTDNWGFICTTTAGTRGFTVGSSILNQLPASTSGSLSIVSAPTPSTFNASLTAGGSIDLGTFLALTGTGGTVAYQ